MRHWINGRTDWATIARFLDRLKTGHTVAIPTRNIGPPRDADFRRDVGWPAGQQSDWRYTRPDCTDVHVQERDGFWEAHLDRVAPSCSLVGHVREDMSQLWTILTTASGAALGKAVVGREGALAGGLIGLLFGVATKGPRLY